MYVVLAILCLILSKIVTGGAFPLPPSAAHLCTLLPPPNCFTGPFVLVDNLIDIFNKIQIPETRKYLFHLPLAFANLFCLQSPIQQLEYRADLTVTALFYSASSTWGERMRYQAVWPSQVCALGGGRECWWKEEEEEWVGGGGQWRRGPAGRSPSQRHLSAAPAEAGQVAFPTVRGISTSSCSFIVVPLMLYIYTSMFLFAWSNWKLRWTINQVEIKS